MGPEGGDLVEVTVTLLPCFRFSQVVPPSLGPSFTCIFCSERV